MPHLDRRPGNPVSAFLRAAWAARECFLLESVEGGEQVGRYTFIGLAPFKRIVARGRNITITEGRKVTRLEDDVFAVLRRALSGHKPARLPGLPPFTAGAVGYFAYDAVRQIERLPELAKDELGVPDACLLFFDEVLAFDHVRKEIWLVVTADVTHGKPADAYEKAIRRLDKLEKRLAQPLPRLPQPKVPGKKAHLKVKYRTSKKAYMDAVVRIRSTSPPETSSRPCCRSVSTWNRRWTASRCTARCGPSTPVHTCFSCAFLPRAAGRAAA